MDKDCAGVDPVSILDIARRAKVSPATVSRVFNRPEKVSGATREQVRAICRELGYRPNASASTLRTQRSRVLGVILPTLTNPVFAECLQGIAQATAALGYSIMPATTDYRVEIEQEAVTTLQSFGVDGTILVVSDAETSIALQMLAQRQRPYVLVYNRHPDHPTVSVAGDTALRDLVHELVQLGHRRIAMVCGQLDASDRAQQRLAGFMQGMHKAGLTPQPLVQVPFVETAIEDVARVLRAPSRPTALVCSNDLIAIRALRAAHECGLRVPADLSITGFDGIRLGHDLTPILSTVVQPNQDMGRHSVELLLRALREGRQPTTSESITLPYHFFRGESCAQAPF
ncbi:LacI family transcriptional regulator [Pollutimonas subterranea]|uniref:LacI family transcriptional regulator n=1 Tax=Pollutimonas subterranea TaxID=2045210 RepID=A0A2N4U3U9_9BURK|nr:LacI family DNA-binding transcriptional regulator [Pollutimonas subterranea]PLC49679.1 LacI family transcriptional regulator [Pollutimonas subterranea]